MLVENRAGWLSLASGLGIGCVCLLFFVSFDSPWALRGENKISLFPMYADAWRQWQSGHVPVWTSGMFGGFPLLAGVQSAAFYPLHAVAFALTPAPHWRAMDLSLALHAGLLAAGSVRLLLRLELRPLAAVLAGVVVCMAPQVVYWTNFVPVFAALAWWPWLFLAADRLSEPERPAYGAIVLGAVALAAQVLVGYIEFAVYSGCIAAAWVLATPTRAAFGRRAVRVALLAVSGGLLAAPQLLPTLMALPWGGREALELAPLPQQWAGVSALFDPREGARRAGLTSTFLGAATLLLALSALVLRARRSTRLAVLAGVAALLSFEAATPLYGWLTAVPPFSFFRTPLKFWVVVNFSVVLLAAVGFQALVSRGSRRWAVVGFALGTMALVEYAAHLSFELPVVASGHLRGELEVPSGLASFEAFLPILLPADSVGPPPRAAYIGWAASFGSLGEVYGVESILGHSPALLGLLGARQAQLLHRSIFQGFGWLDRDWLDRLGVQWVVVQGRCARFRGRGLERLKQEETMCLLRNPSQPPRFELLEEATLVADTAAELERIQTRPAAAVPVVASAAAGAGSRAGGAGQVEALSYRPGVFRLQTKTEEERLLLVREARNEGWKAQVDGTPTPIFPAAGLFFAVPIPAGVHVIDIVYEARGLELGVGLAGVWILASGALWWRARKGSG
jgi:hypothetical protein